MSSSSRPRRVTDVPHLVLDGGVVLYDGTNLQLLEGAASHVWERLDGTTGVEELVLSLASTFGVSTDVVSGDVDEFLTDLRCRSLLDESSDRDLVLARGVGWSRDGRDVLLVHLLGGQRRALTGTGAEVWDMILSLHNQTAVIEALQDRYSGAPSTLVRDVVDLVEALVAAGFLLRR